MRPTPRRCSRLLTSSRRRPTSTVPSATCISASAAWETSSTSTSATRVGGPWRSTAMAGAWSTSPRSASRRAAGMQPLPTPARGGSVETLRNFLNVQGDGDFTLVVAWALAVLRDRGPYPVLVLSGEQGSAKSTFSAVLRPSCARLASTSRSSVRAAPGPAPSGLPESRNVRPLARQSGAGARLPVVLHWVRHSERLFDFHGMDFGIRVANRSFTGLQKSENADSALIVGHRLSPGSMPIYRTFSLLPMLR